MKKFISLFIITISISLISSLSFADPIWIDVRTVEEYNDDHIEGDANIPFVSIDIASLSSLYDKDDEINLYCRSGNRAGKTKTLLEEAGFTNVHNLGGINDVRELREIAAQNSSQ